MLDHSISSIVVSDSQRAVDLEMVPFDIWGTRAHVCMLHHTRIIDSERASKILAALGKIEALYQQGKFQIDPERGAQLSLEKAIVEIAGEEAGLSTHTARSRNDQVMVTELLYLREKALGFYKTVAQSAALLLELADKNIETVMPGYTHMQPGKPSTFAHWCLAYHDSLIRSLEALTFCLEQYDSSPLGAVESFGTSWPIDRSFTAELLGFSKVWEVPQDAISHRGFFQLNLLAVLNQAGLSLSKIATDLMLYSTFEYSMVGFGSNVAQRLHPITGSSVMAQKKNPDALELIRSISPQISGLLQVASGLLCNLPSGYNRDAREIKEYIEIALRKSSAGFEALSSVLSTLEVKKERMRELVIQNYSLTTDFADHLSQKSGVPYRKVYKIVGDAVHQVIESGRSLTQLLAKDVAASAQRHGINLNISESDLEVLHSPEKALQRRDHIGGTCKSSSAAMLESRRQGLKSMLEWPQTKIQKIESARAQTANYIKSLA